MAVKPTDRSTAERVYRGATKVFALVIASFGIVIVVLTLARGGGIGAVGLWFGILFFALGLTRLYLATRG